MRVRRVRSWITDGWRGLGRSLRGLPLLPAVCLAITGAVAIALLVTRILRVVIHTSAKEADPIDITKLAFTVAGGVGAAVALVVAYRRQRDLEQGRFVERFGAAAAQLGDHDVAVRIAGVYAMAGVADESTGLRRQQCIDVLCGYLRLPYSPEQGSNHRTKLVLTEPRTGDDGSVLGNKRSISNTVRTTKRSARPSCESSPITCRLRNVAGPHAISTSAPRTWKMSTSVTQCSAAYPVRQGDVLRRRLVHGATFSGDAGFDEATFSGTAWFNGATFSGDAGFDEATFSGDARFDEATFSGAAGFDEATFFGDAGFKGATFSGSAPFDKATFSGDAWFGGAMFSGDTRFGEAMFSGGAGFDEATFSGRACAWFDKATFSGRTRFDKATFSGDAWFDDATFSG